MSKRAGIIAWDAHQLTGDFTPPTVRSGGNRGVRVPRVARLVLVGRDNKAVTDLEVLVDGSTCGSVTGMAVHALSPRARVRVAGAATAASLFCALLVGSPAVPNSSAPGMQAGASSEVPPSDDDVGPSVEIQGRRRVRAPDAARIRVVGTDNQEIRNVEILYSHARIVQRPPPGVHVKRLELSLSLRRPGRYRLRVIAADATGVNSGYKRATVIVSPSRAGTT